MIQICNRKEEIYCVTTTKYFQLQFSVANIGNFGSTVLKHFRNLRDKISS